MPAPSSADSPLSDVARREAALLAPYAMHSADSRGRKYPEPDHPYRGPFQRDRDRILHSSAYRRLSGKMQVFTGEMGDYHRTRLTHTHEVASIARTIARALALNEDLVEALALLHDIGHPPFGHAGESALHQCLAEDGGFSHNQHALTIAEELEVRYHRFNGLNLTREVLDGQAARADQQIGKADACPVAARLLETQVVDLADSITYDAHDTDDAVKLGLVTLADLSSNALIRESMERVRRQTAALAPTMLRKAVVHDMIDFQVNDVLQASSARLQSCRVDAPRSTPDLMLTLSDELTTKKVELESFLYQRVYRHERLVRVRQDAQQRIQRIFAGLLEQPELLPVKHRLRADRVGLRRAVGEYIAGMTDRFCDQQFREHFQ